jgi:hypothetical protein
VVLVVRTATGAFATGAFATGAFATGAFATGAFATGAFAFVPEGVATRDCRASAGEQTSKLTTSVPRILIRNE